MPTFVIVASDGKHRVFEIVAEDERRLIAECDDNLHALLTVRAVLGLNGVKKQSKQPSNSK